MQNKIIQFYTSLFEPALHKNQYIELREIQSSGTVNTYYFSSVNELADKASELDGNDSGKYFGACPRFRVAEKGKAGRKEDISLVTALYLDLDVGKVGHAKASYFDSKESALEFIQHFPLKPSWIIDTGNGLDPYWLIDPVEVNTDTIEAVEKTLKGVAVHFHADLNSAELARVLRCPGPWNKKRKHGAVPVSTGFVDEQYYDPAKTYKLEDFDEYRTLYEKAELPQRSNSQTMGMAIRGKKGDIAKVIERCKFIQWCRDNQSEVPEPLWYAMITNLVYFDAGCGKIHEFSEKYPGYSWMETEEKVNHALKDAPAPHTCRYIQENGFADCPRGRCGRRAPAGLGWDSNGEGAVTIENGAYYRDEKKLTTFVLEPKKLYVSRKTRENIICVDIVSESGTVYEDVFLSKEAWTGRVSFMRSLRGEKDLNLFCTDIELQHIRAFNGNDIIPEVETVESVGIHEHGKEYLLVLPNGTIDKNGDRRCELAYHSETGDSQSVCMLNAEMLDADEANIILNDLFNYNSLDVTVPVNAWVFFVPFMSRLFKAHKQSPFLLMHGEAGAGKTATIQHILFPFFGLEGSSPASIGFTKKFGLIKSLSASNCIPAIFDENKISKQMEADRATISEMLRSSYNQGVVARGRPDQRLNQYRLIAPVIISGEENFNEPAISHRCIDVMFSKNTRDVQATKAFTQLIKANLRGFGKDYFCWSLSLNDERILEVFEKALRTVKAGRNERVVYNIACLKFGLLMCADYFKARHGIEINGLETLLAKAEEVQTKNMETGSESVNTIDAIIEALNVMASTETVRGDRYLLNDGEDYKVEGNELRVNVSKIYPKFMEWGRRTSYSGDMMDKNTFIKQLKSQKYYLTWKSAKIGSITQKCYILDLSKMEHLEMSAFRYAGNIVPKEPLSLNAILNESSN